MKLSPGEVPLGVVKTAFMRLKFFFTGVKSGFGQTNGNIASLFLSLQLFLLLLWNTNGSIKFEDGGDGEADNPFIAVGEQHQCAGHYQK